MRLNELHYIRACVNASVETAKRKGYTRIWAINDILDTIIYNLFWNYETDMPTVNCDMWERFIINTVQKMM